MLGAAEMMNRSTMFFVAALAAFAMTAAAFRAGAGMFDLQPQIDAAAARGGGVVRVPAGEREVLPFVLKSNVTLELAQDAVLLASTNLADYSEIPERRCVIYAENATNVAIVGKGMVNGRGGVFKAQKIPLEAAPRDRPYMMNFTRCRNLRLEGFGFRDSGAWGIHLRNCDGVTVRGVTCISHSNRNNDGIDVESSNVLIEDCDIDSGDDAIVLKTESDKSFQVTNVVVRNCRLASRCNAFKFGTGSYNAFRDVLLENCRLERPKYFSARSRRGYYRNNFVPSLYDGGAPCGLSAIELAVVDGGSIENVTMRNIEIDGYLQAFHIRQHHRHEPEDGKVDTYLRNVLIENVKGTVDGRLASAITGVPAKDGAAARRPSDITLRNVHLTVLGGGTEEDAKRAVPEKDGAYPACWMFDKKPLPAYGFYVRHADNIVFDDVSIVPRRPDARPPFVFDDCTGCVQPKATKPDMIAAELRRRILPEGSEFSAHDAILAELCAADKAADDAWRALKSRAEYDARRAKMRERLVEAIGGLGFERTPLNAKVTERVPRDGYSIEKVIFESRPGVYVTAHAFVPDAARFKPPYRGIIEPCGHTAEAKGTDFYQRGGVMGALAGFVVLIYDPFAQGERRMTHGGLCGNHNRYGALAALLGQSMAQQRIWDGMRAIDYLYSRDDVRKDGVGCMGQSGGGTMTALMEAVDSRIVAACPAEYISSLREVVGAMGPQDAEQNVFGQLSFGFNHAGFVLLGGNAVRMHCSFEDFFPIAGSRETYAVVRDTAKACGLVAGRYGLTDVPGPHAWTEGMRTSSLQWMRRRLAGDATTPEIDVEACRRIDVGFNLAKVDHGLTGKAAFVTPKGDVAKLPGFKSIFDYLKDDLARAEKNRGGRVTSRAGIRPLADLGVSVREARVPQTLADGTTILCEVYSFGDGIQVPALTFLPKGEVKGVVMVTDDRASRMIHKGRVPQVLAQGKAIMVADLACTGETGGIRHRFYGSRNPDEGPAVMLYLLGKSMVGVRAEEMIALADALKRRTGKSVEIVAHGRTCISAAHAFAVRRDLVARVECILAPKSWAESVRTSEVIPFANVVNGALLDYDWTELMN